MDSRKHSVDLEKELTCSICTELLYQPLTLLDCLHTYCGACLKEWFRFQAATAERAPNPNPPSPDAAIFTCPSCRSSVRDTRHNATVATLLDMFVAANPGKARSEGEKREMAEKYKPGEQVMPKVKTRKRTAEERRAEQEDRRLLEEVRERSLREAVAEPTSQPRPRRRGDSRPGDERTRSSRNGRSENHSQRTRDDSHHDRGEVGARSSVNRLSSEGHRRRRSESRQRQVEHQSSLRSLIGSQMSEREIEREIEEFARQIQEEGLLDGLDLDNIDLSRDDELSRRITEAYRRRQRDRPRQEPARRSNTSGHSNASRHTGTSPVSPRPRPSSARPQSRHRTDPRPTSEAEDRSRPPLSTSANLEVRAPERRARRRTTSGGGSATAPMIVSGTDTRPAARSQTDLPLRSQASDPIASVQDLRGGRSSSMHAVPLSARPAELPAINGANNASFASRIPQGHPAAAHAAPKSPDRVDPTVARPTRLHRPTDLTTASALVANPIDGPIFPAPLRVRPHLYDEPSISCSRCNKLHIEYDLHYNCKICSDGQWNSCRDCYRAGNGCLYWFGFGYGAWKKWEKRKQAEDSAPMPHMLNASRYQRPTSTPRVGADAGEALTKENPRLRLETGAFCAKCYAWSNHFFWRCDACNEGDWGFCNDCVNQGKSCGHDLLPLAHEQSSSVAQGPPRSPRSPVQPATATVLAGSQIPGIGPFKPLALKTKCGICQDGIMSSQARYHCFSCASAVVQDASPGDYDICSSCYSKLEAQGRISAENGHSGWRRCLNGHRMVVVGFVEGKIGQWRHVERDLVGGRALRSESFESNEHAGLQKWSWHQGSEKLERLVTKDVSSTAPISLVTTSYAPQTYPPDGGTGLKGHAMWAWYPKAGAEDELMFPRGADISEIQDINGDWFFGTYMGSKGLFPAPYVRTGRS